MQRIEGMLIFSPSDLVTYFQSPFASWMERARLENPSLNELIDPEVALLSSLAKQGYAHEASFNQSVGRDFLCRKWRARIHRFLGSRSRPGKTRVRRFHRLGLRTLVCRSDHAHLSLRCV